jgi:hypothetical protein
MCREIMSYISVYPNMENNKKHMSNKNFNTQVKAAKDNLNVLRRHWFDT